MSMIFEILEKAKKELEETEFHQMLYEIREKLGLRLYRVALFSKIPMGRLKRLESGLFRSMPSSKEIKNLSQFYGIEEKVLERKAKEFLKTYKPEKKKYV